MFVVMLHHSQLPSLNNLKGTLAWDFLVSTGLTKLNPSELLTKHLKFFRFDFNRWDIQIYSTYMYSAICTSSEYAQFMHSFILHIRESDQVHSIFEEYALFKSVKDLCNSAYSVKVFFKYSTKAHSFILHIPRMSTASFCVFFTHMRRQSQK